MHLDGFLVTALLATFATTSATWNGRINPVSRSAAVYGRQKLLVSPEAYMTSVSYLLGPIYSLIVHIVNYIANLSYTTLELN